MIYVASPYTHPDPAVRQFRYEEVCEYTAMLLRAGINAYSPIAHSHGMHRFGLPQFWTFWATFDGEMIGFSECVVVLQLPGWMESVGIKAELDVAAKTRKPLYYQPWPAQGEKPLWRSAA